MKKRAVIEKSPYYQKILDNIPDWDFGTPAKEVINKFAYSTDKTFLSVTAQVTAPVLTAYVLWVLRDAQRSGIKNLLFMARDGFVMYEIAKILCKKWNIEIECMYFYASRFSLRVPMYALDKKYALDKICGSDMLNPTARKVLATAGLQTHQINEVLCELAITGDDILNNTSLNDLKFQLNNCRLFDRYAQFAANEALINTKGYFQCVPDNFAIVDSGWVGTIQECFGKLHENFTGKSPKTLSGYYFGLLALPPPDSGTYKSYYFSFEQNQKRAIGFCVDLFESMCAAGHGKVMGYECEAGQWKPILAPYKPFISSSWEAATQIELCKTYAFDFAKLNNNNNETPHAYYFVALIKSFMQKPSTQEATVFGAIPFSESVVEHEIRVLAHKLTSEELKQYSFVYRLLGKIRCHKKQYEKSAFWIQGTLALSAISWLRYMDIKLLLAIYRLKMRVQFYV